MACKNRRKAQRAKLESALKNPQATKASNMKTIAPALKPEHERAQVKKKSPTQAKQQNKGSTAKTRKLTENVKATKTDIVVKTIRQSWAQPEK